MAPSTSKDAKNEYCRQLDALQQIRAIAGSSELDLPQTCVVGDQSSGKSSLLSELTGICFPVKNGICTRAPIVVECKLNAKVEQDVYEIAKEGSIWVQVPRAHDLAKEISAMQNEALLKAETPAKISTEEIRVRVCGPKQINIIVIDLPGIIHNGAGKAETKELIDSYIQQEQTLILLVSEAKQDDEGCAAIGMAKEWDEDAKRTIRVFTKCDTWDSNASKHRLEERMREQAFDDQNNLLPHAVICRMQGRSTYDADSEMKELKAIGIPQQRAGLLALKDRLPLLYAELIRTFLPSLKERIELLLQDAKEKLHEVGEQARSGDSMLRACQTVLLHSCVSKLQEPISEHFQVLKASIEKTESKVTMAWSDVQLKPNIFECPFFQGGAALQSCMKEITDWWRPIMTKYVEQLEQVAQNHILTALREQTQAIPMGLHDMIHREWNIQCCLLVSELKTILENRLQKEIYWGTVNHDLTSNFKGEEALPDSLVEDMLSHLKRKQSTPASLPDPKRIKTSFSSAPDLTISVNDLRQELISAKKRWSNEYKNKSLHEQQQQRLFHAVKAMWNVEHKTFTDYILKETFENLVAKRNYRVSTEFFANVNIKEAAVEDHAHQQMRKDLKDKKERLEKCMRQLQSISN